jgi:hypothetical protein
MKFGTFAFNIMYQPRDTTAYYPQVYYDSHKDWRLCVHLIYIHVCMYVCFFYLLMKHAPSLEGNTTCYVLVGNAGSAPNPGTVSALPSHFIIWLYYVLSLSLLLLEYIEIY